MQDILQQLTQLLAQDERLVSAGKLIKNKVIELGLAMDSSLIRLLLQNPRVKAHFFTQVDDILIFDKIKFQKFISNKSFLADSYTAYKNKIGLQVQDEYLTDAKEVVLAWPYKDCFLEGGQDREDAKRSEIFWNETLAADQLDRLLAPKVLTNFQHYTSQGMTRPKQLDTKPNLLIKGNNLLALHTLKQNYAGKIKLIYIDPPYGTDSDSFNYNDSFKRSTLLTFLKNRLAIAKELLSPDGFIIIQSSFHHYAYLEVLCDELLGEKCWRTTFNVLVRHPQRTLTGDKEFNDVVEFALVYSKTETTRLPFNLEEKVDAEYVYNISLNHEPDKLLELGNKTVEVYYPGSYQVNKAMPSAEHLKSISVRGSIREKNSSGRFYVKYLEPLSEEYPALTLFKVPQMGDDAYGHRFFHLPKTGNKNGTYYQGMPLSSSTTKKPVANFLDFVEDYNVVNSEGGVYFRNGKKPEAYIGYFIQMLTQPEDIVLDFFAGSGTTAATAHKLGRRYIAIEQMDYIQTITLNRLLNTLKGEQQGISTEIDWQGGGEFIYCELAKANQSFIEQIERANSSAQLLELWQIMKSQAFLSYQLDLELFETSQAEFSQYSLEEQKQLLIACLDKNMLYVPLTEIADASYSISQEDQQLNAQFFAKGSKNG